MNRPLLRGLSLNKIETYGHITDAGQKKKLSFEELEDNVSGLLSEALL